MFKRIYRKLFCKPGVLVISYPKSGRTWLRVMLDYCNIELTYYHIDSKLREKIPFYVLNSNLTEFKKHPVILMIREPKDIMVSSYFHATKRLRDKFEGSLSDFIRDERYGIRKVITFNKIWLANQKIFRRFMVISYEDLHEDTFGTLQKILAFSNKEVNERFLQKAIQHGEFKNMREMELSNNHTYGNRLEPGDVDDTESYKVRKGVVGGFKDYLSKEDIDYCNEVIKEMHYSFNDSDIYS